MLICIFVFSIGNKYYENAALLTILRQEVDRYNKLLNTIHKTLNSLIRAIKGEIIISQSLEETFASLLMQKVPIEWEVSIKSFYDIRL